MRRVVFTAVIAAISVSASACSSPVFGDDTSRPTATPTHTDGPLPTSQQFDRPFPISGEAWDATVTLSDLRIVPSSTHSDRVVAVNVRAVQSSGQPVIAPTDLTALDPAGEPFEQIRNPGGTLQDPLVETVMTSPGQEVRGMVAWTMPENARIGRIDMVTPGTVSSVIVTRQPVDPSATTRTQPTT